MLLMRCNILLLLLLLHLWHLWLNQSELVLLFIGLIVLIHLWCSIITWNRSIIRCYLMMSHLILLHLLWWSHILAFMQLLLKEWVWSLTSWCLHTSFTMLTLIQDNWFLCLLFILYFIYDVKQAIIIVI